MAEAHFRIEKSVDRGQATATVERVDGDELVAEIVRMLGGGDGDEAVDRHARELLRPPRTPRANRLPAMAIAVRPAIPGTARLGRRPRSWSSGSGRATSR